MAKFFIPPDIAQQISEQTDLGSFIEHYQELKKSGSSRIGQCPACGAVKKFSFTPAKKIAKCFSCDVSAVDAISYLTNFKQLPYPEAVKDVAAFINFDLEAAIKEHKDSEHITRRTPGKKVQAVSDSTFRDRQLAASGIPDAAQQYTIEEGGKEVIKNRYTYGSLDAKGNPAPGHDMLLHYLDLDGQPIKYQNKEARGERDYIRIRHAHPELHTDKEGREVRYKSPYQGGNHLWVSESIRRKFVNREKIDTLVFVEGEKKADALCLIGIPAAGIAGIHNFAKDNEMPSQIERLISGCEVKNVVFWFDSDLDELGSDINPNADFRPRTFASAAIKFRTYFEKYNRSGYNIQIFLIHGNDKQHKGADDLLVALGPVSEKHPLKKDFDDALKSQSGKTKLLTSHQITSWSDFKIQELWDIHSQESFCEKHKDRLKEIPEFKFNRIRYRWDAEEGAFINAQRMHRYEQFWKVAPYQKGRSGPRTEINYTNLRTFLENRGFWRMHMGLNQYRLIQIEDNIVREVDNYEVKDFVDAFTETLKEPEVLELLLSQGSNIFSNEKLRNLRKIQPDVITPKRDSQVLVFQDQIWVVSAKGVEVKKLTEMPGLIWQQNVIQFKPTHIPDFLSIRTDSPFGGVDVSYDVENADVINYLVLTSDINHKDRRNTSSTFPDRLDDFNDKDKERCNVMNAVLADKIIAAGYILSDYMSPEEQRAVICLDAVEPINGRAQGGTGKSIYGGMFEHALSMLVIDAKQEDLTGDKFLYDGLDENTRAILFDDCRKGIDFEFFLSQITRGVTANSKGVSKKKVGNKRFIFTTNYSIKGEDRSFLRRQYPLLFGDYFNEERTPATVFGHSLFTREWPHEQWNYAFNFFAYALKEFFIHRLKTFASDEDVTRRRLRETITEDWMEMFENYFDPAGPWINRRHEINEFVEAFKKQFPKWRQIADKKIFKIKADLYCRYKGFKYNLPAAGGRIRNGSTNQEYFVFSDDRFDPKEYADQLNYNFDPPPAF